MKKNQFVTLAVVAAFIGAILFINRHEPARVSEQRKQKAAEAQRLVEEANPAAKPQNFQDIVRKKAQGMLGAAVAKRAESAVSGAVTSDTQIFQVEFQCSTGTFVVEVHPEWSPLGAAQFRAAVEDGVYNDARFFRVLPTFIVQFGIPGDPEKAATWENRRIQDEPVQTPNARGTITFAKGGPNTRTTQVFINLGDNVAGSEHDLDSIGFPPFGKVIKGMEVVDKIFSEYRQDPDQGEITTRGNAYLKENFPKMDYIKEAKILGTVAPATPPAPVAPAETAPVAAAPAPAQPQN